MKRATWKSSGLVGIVLGAIAGLAATYESWTGLVVLVISFFYTVYQWVFGAETLGAIKEEKKRRGQYWFEPMDEVRDLQFFAPLFGRCLIFFVTFGAVATVIIVSLKEPNQPPEPIRASAPR